MAQDIPTAPELCDTATQPSIASLLRGILDDAMELMRQQFAMFKAELRSDFEQVRNAVIYLAAGIAPLLLGGLMLCFSLVHLIHWATAPAGTDPATLPLWVCYLIVAGAFLILGGGLLGLGIYRLKTVNPLPDESARALEENVKWLMNPK
jgi:hypothetical protein